MRTLRKMRTALLLLSLGLLLHCVTADSSTTPAMTTSNAVVAVATNIMATDKSITTTAPSAPAGGSLGTKNPTDPPSTISKVSLHSTQNTGSSQANKAVSTPPTSGATSGPSSDPVTHTVLPSQTKAPKTSDQPTTAPKTSDQPTTPPKTQDQPTTPPKTQDQPTTLPKTQDKTTTPPKTTEQPTAAPKTQDQPTTPPKTQDQPTTPPKTQDETTTPPKTQGQPIPSPKTQDQPTTPPKTQGQPTTPPKTQDQPTTAPKTQDQPTTPPKTQDQPTTPPKTQDQPTTTPEPLKQQTMVLQTHAPQTMTPKTPDQQNRGPKNKANPASPVPTIPHTEIQTKIYIFPRSEKYENDDEINVAACRKLMGTRTNGTCFVRWSGHGKNIHIEAVVNISVTVDAETANKVWDEFKETDLTTPPTKPGDKTTLIAILASCGALLAMIIGLGIYATHHRKPYHENQQHLTEELHTVENGYHDNPTLEVMEVQPEMQEKKAPPCSEFNDSWIVPMETMNKEVLPDEEDTHL